MNNKIFYRLLLLIWITTLVGCSEDTVKPTLKSTDTFKAPVLLNEATSSPVEFTADNPGEEFETFEWETADYGVNVPVRYIIEVSQLEDFGSSAIVKQIEGSGTSAVRSVSVLNQEMNNAMLALGLVSGEESTVHVRLFSFIEGVIRDTLVSNVIQRTATPFRTSDCGAYCSIGLIGDATPGGWNIDTDMRLADPEGIDKSTWVVTVYLTAGEVKFRAMDAWDTDWGLDGVQGGPNIPVTTPGYYKVTFNDQTGDYSFVPAGTNIYASMGLIGAQSDWGSDIVDLTQSEEDDHIWTATFALNAGAVKFRAEDAWDNNWGGTTFPSGYGIGGGADIIVPVSGTYFIYFNDASGEYFFAPATSAMIFNDIGVIGDATPGGWDNDTNLIRNPSNPYKWSGKVIINNGEAKFRADNAWDVNWGASVFPQGVGANGGANIPVQAGEYFITFNTATGEYYFLK